MLFALALASLNLFLFAVDACLVSSYQDILTPPLESKPVMSCSGFFHSCFAPGVHSSLGATGGFRNSCDSSIKADHDSDRQSFGVLGLCLRETDGRDTHAARSV